MRPEESKVYVRFVDGVDVFVPVKGRPIGDGTFQLLPDSEFDYADDTVLFEFGAGDVVSTQRQAFENETMGILACELVSEGDERNLRKRILFWILQSNPNPDEVLRRIGKNKLRYLLGELVANSNPYEGIRNWLALHEKVIQQFIM